VYVANCMGKNSHAVAELSMSLMLAIDRRISDCDNLLKNGVWHKGAFAKCRGLKDRNMGIIGMGNIGKLMVKRAKAFEMNVFVDDSFNKVAGLDKALDFTYLDRESLLKECDFLTLHVPANPSTRGMINRDFLRKMKSDAVLLNTARGSLNNECDIIEHLNANPNFWMGTDVYSKEPTLASDSFNNYLA